MKDSLLLIHFGNTHMNQKRALEVCCHPFIHNRRLSLPQPLFRDRSCINNHFMLHSRMRHCGQELPFSQALSRAFAAFILAAEPAAHPVLPACTAKLAQNSCGSSQLQTSFASSASETAATSKLLQSRLNLQGQVITLGVFLKLWHTRKPHQHSFSFPHPNPMLALHPSRVRLEQPQCCCVLQ